MATPPKPASSTKEYDAVYDGSRLNAWFIVSAILLLVVTVWMVIDDHAREWKEVQRRFNQREVEEALAALSEAESAVDPQRLDDLRARIAAAEVDLRERESEIRAARLEATRLEGAWYRIDQDYRFAKAVFDAKKYGYEEARGRGAPHVDQLGREIEEMRARMLELGDAAKEAVLAREAADQAVAELTADRDAAESEMRDLRDDIEALETRIYDLGRNFKNTFRNAPVVDFMNPSIKIQQVIVDDLKLDINFMEIPRTDRCITCHVTIDEPGYEQRDNPYRTHPHLDRFVGPQATHPLDGFGCTVCHAGRGWGTTFVSAAHTPHDAEQEHDWHERYGWHEMHHWEYPMLRLQDTEASCFKCHAKEVRIEGAERLNEARLMFLRAGCWGCHKTRGYEGLRKAGPSLERIRAKTDPDWTYLWVMDPPAFRPTRMPKFFGLSNNSAPEDIPRNRVEVGSIVEYLFEHSRNDIVYQDSGLGGDATRGRTIVESVGCLGCHVIGNEAGIGWADPRRFGPNLMGTGSKVGADWLYDWVRDPKHYWPETRMPNLRLSDREARDITAYLMSLKREGIDGFRRPSIDRQILKSIAMEYLTQKLSVREAGERWAAKGADEQVLFVGEKLIARYGCFGCHDIPGFEAAQPIGVELSKHADKPLFQLAFGFVDIPHTRRDFFLNKLKDPRIYDLGLVKPPQDRLRMPQFSFTDEEAELMTINLLGFAKEEIAVSKLPEPTSVQIDTQEGWWMVHERNCIGCHSFDGYGGAIGSTIADQAMHPPMIIREGAKANPDWLFRFLKEPTPIRPWLDVRMPTFEFNDPEATDLVKYFVALEDETLRFRSAHRIEATREELAEGRQTFESFQCQKCHVVGDELPGGSPADWAPDLSMAHGRLQPEWIDEWLKDPQIWLPGTRMPNYFYYYDEDEGYEELYPDAATEIRNLREYLLSLGAPRVGAAAGRRASP